MKYRCLSLVRLMKYRCSAPVYSFLGAGTGLLWTQCNKLKIKSSLVSLCISRVSSDLWVNRSLSGRQSSWPQASAGLSSRKVCVFACQVSWIYRSKDYFNQSLCVWMNRKFKKISRIKAGSQFYWILGTALSVRSTGKLKSLRCPQARQAL